MMAVEGSIFRYGFEVTPTEVCKEWLYKKACKLRSKEIELFYRENGQFNVHAKYSQAKELVNKKMIRDNALLLSTLTQFNDPTAVSLIRWLGVTQCLTEQDEAKIWKDALKHLDDPNMRRRIVAFSQFADLGLDDIEKVNNRLVSTHAQFGENGDKAGNVSFPFEVNESEGTLKFFSFAYPSYPRHGYTTYHRRARCKTPSNAIGAHRRSLQQCDNQSSERAADFHHPRYQFAQFPSFPS